MSDKTITITNFEMEHYISILSDFLDRADIIGYAAARNTRLLTEASLDHMRIKNELLRKYGSVVKDVDGNETNEIAITDNDEHFDDVKTQLDISGNTKHHVNLFMISYDDVINKLTGYEILSIDWMIEH